MCVSYCRHKKSLVRSPVSTTVPQISSRLYMVWGILYSFPEVQTHPLISSLVISWCIAEIVRYAFYGTKEAFGSAPYLLLWLSYSTFFVLYPTGIASEIGMIYNALPIIRAVPTFSEGLIELRSGGPFEKLSFSTYLVTKPYSFVRAWD
ncbi:putative very-long-chain (3R)-3-hydroxyacyl-CoA dehydratase [Helianthus anomalus]